MLNQSTRLVSLSATFLRLHILGALRTSKEFSRAADTITQNIIYTYPTVDALTDFILAIVDNPEGTHLVRGGVDAVEAMITKYISGLELPITLNSTKAEKSTVVLLTGSTGNIGAQILSNLLEDKAVDRVYALNRPSSASQSMLERHKARFEDKNLDVSLLDTERLVFVEADASEERFGLDEATYEEVSGYLVYSQ
jgi:hypothetical protein